VVIIPSYNKPLLLRTTIHSATANAHYPHQIVVSDDESPDGDMKGYLERLRRDLQVRVLSHNTAPHGFPHNVNFAVREVGGEADVVVLLNPDTKACGGWLAEMMKEFEDPDVGVVGAKLVYPKDAGHGMADCIQHAGVAFDSAGSPYHIWRGVNKHDPEVNTRREINCVTFACAGIRMKTWKELGGLDEDFVGGQFEDVDFNLRARAAGWKVVYQPKCELYHIEHGSAFPAFNEATQVNFARLHRKWPNMTSDEYLFRPFQWSLITDEGFMAQAAKLFHTTRVGGMRYAMEHDGNAAVRKATLQMSGMGYDAQPENEKRICLGMAEQLAELLKTQKEVSDA
jgi:GT2 family glycosyltransferase